MPKYHVNPETGNPGVCRATKQCRFGEDSEHFNSKEAAEKAFEKTMVESLPASLQKTMIAEKAESLKQQYEFPAWRVVEAINRIDKANRRAERAGIEDRFSYEIETYEVREMDKNGLQTVKERALLTLNRPSLKHDGWSFSGTMSWDPEVGLITRMAPGEELIEKPKAELCDVCKTTRHRTDTYIVQKDGEQKQVGSNCLKRFMGIKPAGLWMLDFELNEDYPDHDPAPAGGNNWRNERRDSKEIMGIGLAIVENQGWISRSLAQETERTSTADRVIDVLSIAPRKRADAEARLALLARGKELQDEVHAILKEAREIEGDSEYAQNLRALAGADSVTVRNIPLLLSAIAAKQKRVSQEATKKARAQSEWMGQIKEKLSPRKVTVNNVKTTESNYGYNTTYSRLVSMTDEDGNVYKSFYSGGDTIEEGKSYVLDSSTVKSHQEWQGAKETLVTRIKLESLRPSKLPATKLSKNSPYAQSWTPEETSKINTAENKRLKKEFKKKAGPEGWDNSWDRPRDSKLVQEWDVAERETNKEFTARYEELTKD